eukprot:RCo022267
MCSSYAHCPVPLLFPNASRICTSNPCSSVDECCTPVSACNISILGRVGNTGVINGMYHVAGIWHEKPFYLKDATSTSYLFFDPSRGWVIGSVLADGQGYSAYNPQNATFPQLISALWNVGTSADPLVQAVCASKSCSTFSACPVPLLFSNMSKICAQDPCSASACCAIVPACNISVVSATATSTNYNGVYVVSG